MSLESQEASAVMAKWNSWNTLSLKALYLFAFKWEYCITCKEMDVNRETHRAELLLFPANALVPDSKSLYYVSTSKEGTVWKPIIDPALRREGDHGKVSSRATDVV